MTAEGLLQDVAIRNPVKFPSSKEKVTSPRVPHLLPFGYAANFSRKIDFESDGSAFKVTRVHVGLTDMTPI